MRFIVFICAKLTFREGESVAIVSWFTLAFPPDTEVLCSRTELH